MNTKTVFGVFGTSFIIVLSICSIGFGGQAEDMEDIIELLQTKSFVDLSHAFSPSTPMPDGLPQSKREEIFGGAVQIFTHVGQFGTHLDAPGHFHKGMRLVDAIPVKEFILKGCVINVSKQSATNHDYQVQLADVKAWENDNGPIPAGSFVILRTDWSKRWPDPQAYFNKDKNGQKHYPGWGMEALSYLIKEKKVAAIAHETPDTDSGCTCGVDKGWPLEDYVLKQNIWQIENLNNADKLPPRGFIVVVGVPKGEKATGFPTRVFAIMP